MSGSRSVGDAGIGDIVRFFSRNYVAIFVVPIVAGVVVYLGTALMTPIYRAETQLVPAEESGAGSLSAMLSNFGGLGRLAGIGSAGPTRKDEALAMLRSRAFVAAFIESAQGLAVLYPDEWDNQTGTWQPGAAEPTEQDQYLRFVEQVLRVSENEQTGIITVGITLDDRMVAAQWANDIVRQLNQTFRESVAAEAQRSIEYLYGELEAASSVELRQVIHRLIETQIQTVMLSNVRKDFVFRVIDPAVAPDADHLVAPRRVLMAALAIVLAGFLGLAFALTRAAMLAARRTDVAPDG